MENNQKPDWFELADNDQPATLRFKGKVPTPKRNLALILAGVLVLPMGAGWALLSHEDQSANAVETLNLTQDSPIATSSTPTQTSNAFTMPTASREDDDEDERRYQMTICSTEALPVPRSKYRINGVLFSPSSSMIVLFSVCSRMHDERKVDAATYAVTTSSVVHR